MVNLEDRGILDELNCVCVNLLSSLRVFFGLQSEEVTLGRCDAELLNSLVVSICDELSQLKSDIVSNSSITSQQLSSVSIEQFADIIANNCFNFPSRLICVEGNSPDSIDIINKISEVSELDCFGAYLEFLIWDVLVDRLGDDEDQILFYASHAARICSQAQLLVKNYIDMLNLMSREKSLTRLSPKTVRFISTEWEHRFGSVEQPATISILNERSQLYDQFYQADAFRYINGQFYKTNLNCVKSIDKFYGFRSIRERFKKCFCDFARGEKNIPLLISSLPGLGKTQYTIAFVKSHDNLTLILPEPSALEAGLENLIAKLAKRPKHRFVLFFDDIDTNSVNWFHFRTHVGGCFALPQNVMLVIASNYEFPANISSRGIGLTYPMFDEVRCLEMISDYLADLGMKNPPNNLVSIIGADYVEEFGMKNFEELSPRTLARYLEIYDKSPDKRRKMLDLSRQDLVTKPDPQSFYDENLRLMKTLYGDEGLRKMREHVLGESEF